MRACKERERERKRKRERERGQTEGEEKGGDRPGQREKERKTWQHVCCPACTGTGCRSGVLQQDAQKRKKNTQAGRQNKGGGEEEGESLFLGSSLNQALRLFQARGYSNKLEVTFFEAFCWGQNNLKNEVISLNLDSVSGIPFFSFLDFAWPWLSCLLLLVWVSG